MRARRRASLKTEIAKKDESEGLDTEGTPASWERPRDTGRPRKTPSCKMLCRNTKQRTGRRSLRTSMEGRMCSVFIDGKRSLTQVSSKVHGPQKKIGQFFSSSKRMVPRNGLPSLTIYLEGQANSVGKDGTTISIPRSRKRTGPMKKSGLFSFSIERQATSGRKQPKCWMDEQIILSRIIGTPPCRRRLRT